MVTTPPKAPSGNASANSWFGPPDGLDSTLIQEAFGGRSATPQVADEQVVVTPYFFRVYRAFLNARAVLALTLLALIGFLHAVGTATPTWMRLMTLGYAGLAWLVWWWPSQRRPAPPQQSTLRPRQALGSIGVDLAFFSALHYLTGSSVNSQALLVLPVLMAGVLMPRIMALGTAAVATLNLLGAAALQGAQGQVQLTQLMTQAGLTGIGLFAIAILSNELATRLAREERSARGSLELARQQAELNRLVLEEMAEGVMVVDRRGRVRTANPAPRRLLPAPGKDMCVMLLEDLRTVRARQRQDKLASMGRMSAGIAHEIRNPLAAIAQANALLAEDALQPGQQKLTQMIGSNVDRLKHIVDDILTVAPGLRPPAPAIDPIETVMAICNEWRSTHRIGGGEEGLLETDFSGCQPVPQQVTLRVRFEPEHLQRVLVNLLDNALRYNSGEPGAILLSLRWVPSVTQEGLLMLSVGNDGEPIQPETERALFEPFFSTSSRGTGLGLYISRELCERHGASIDYRQHPPTVRHRNEFFITMPVDSPAHGPFPA